jgi:hypothetical protein
MKLKKITTFSRLCVAAAIAMVAGSTGVSRADVLLLETFGQDVADNSPIGSAPGWHAYALNGGVVTDYTSSTPNGNYPTLSHSAVGAGTNGVGYLVMGAGNVVNNVLIWTDAVTNLQGKIISDLTFYSRNNAAASTEQVVVRIGSQWFASTATLNDNGGNSTWTLNMFAFSTNASAWRILNTNNLTLGAALGSPLPPGNIAAIGLFGLIQADSGKIRIDEFVVNGTATNAPPSIALPVASPSTNVYAGTTATLSVNAGGTPPLTYLWRRNGLNLTNSPTVSGATSNVLTLSSTVPAQSGSYDVVIANAFGTNTSSAIPLTVSVAAPATVDLSAYTNGGSVLVSSPDTNTLVVSWTNKLGNKYRVQFNLMPGQALLRSLDTAPGAGGAFTAVATNVDARYRIQVGTRFMKAGWPYIFFDDVDANTPLPVAYLSQLNPQTVHVITESPQRLKIVFSTLNLGPFNGDLTCYVYDGSPFVQFQASMLVDRPWTAYIYDAIFYANFANVAYKDSAGIFQTTAAASLPQTVPGEAAKVVAKHRTVLGTVAGGSGTLAVVAPPHTCVYPLDQSDNYGFLQAGKTFIGTKMTFNGDNRYRPWVDAPIGSTQRMDVFLVLSTNNPQSTLTNVLAYTHGDFYKPLPGHYTMEEHFHPEFTANEIGGGNSLTPFKQAMQSIGLQIIMPKEFHGPGHPMNNTTDRLAELDTMFTLFEQHSDTNFLLIPGEEYNNFFGGHWSYTFPKRVYFTGWSGQGGRDFKQTNVVSGGVTYPTVYQVGDAAHMQQLLEEEGGLAWVSHPRIKASRQQPDSFVNTSYFQSDTFLAGDWKAMPADLSKDRLGFRGFQLMNDTAQWGYRKSMMGACDTFALNSTHEIYAHMNVNYLKLPAFPSKTNWSSVVDCLRNGDFFTTTGELLIHSWNASTTGVTATVEWYFPPAFAEITWGDASGVHTAKQWLKGGREFETNQIVIAANLSAANWVRFEVWDVARNGAFTQPYWFNPPAKPAVVAGKATSFTLINADDDVPVPGYDPVPEGAVLNKAVLPPNLTLRANISPLIMDSVTLNLDGNPVTRTQWPYSLATCATGAGTGDSPSYDYAASTLSAGNHILTATPQRGTNLGQSLTLNFSIINTAPNPTNFVMDGTIDSTGYQIAGGLSLYAAVKGNTLYVAAPATDANDQFIMISDSLGSLGAAPWNKAGQVAFNINTKPYLAQSGSTKAVSWSNAGAGSLCPATVPAGFMEGTMDLAAAFGNVPSKVYIALARYAAGTGGVLVTNTQVPVGNGSSNIETNEFLTVPLSSLRDDTLNGVLDVLEPSAAFSAAFSNNPGVFVVRWASVPGYSYRVLSTDNLLNTFQALSPTLVADPGVFSLSYTDAPPPVVSQRLYRVNRPASTANLLSRFQLNGTVGDSGPAALSTTATALTYASDSKEGGLAADFNGTSSVIQTSSANPVSGSFSVAFWLQTTTAGGGAAGDQWFTGTGLVDADTPGVATDWGIALTGNAIAFGIGGGSMGTNMTITSPSVINGAWHQVVATWEQGTRQMALYVGGQVASTGLSTSSETRTGASALVVGKSSTAGRFHNGLLDDVQIYGRALASNEVSFLFNNPGMTLH